MKPNSLVFKKNVPLIKEGLTLDQVWFSGGRTGASILRHGGIGQIVYFGQQSLKGGNMFKSGNPVSAWTKLFRLCVVVDGNSYYPEFNNTRFYPFGYRSECTLADVHFQHELIVLNDAVVQRVKILSNPQGKKLSFKLVFHGFNRVESAHRTWTLWAVDEKNACISAIATDAISEEECQREIANKAKEVRNHFPISDTPYGETHIAIASNLDLSMLSVRNGWKYYVTSEPFESEAAIFLVFSPAAETLTHRVVELKTGFIQECDKEFEKWNQRLATSPRVKIPSSPVVESCLANIPSIVDSMEVKDVPGAYRAGNQYWVWLDLMLDLSGMLYANDAESVRDMLLFFNRHWDQERGVPCSFTTRFIPYHAVAFNQQCVFVTALYNYYCYTGDLATMRECYPVARLIIERLFETEVRGSGLTEGVGFPDEPVEQDGHDITSSNNSYYYQAVLGMRYLSQELESVEPGKGHAQFASTCEASGKRCREGFRKYFFDEEKGYFIDSISSVDFSKRLHYPNFAIQWQTSFAADLVADVAGRVADFMAKNFTRHNGIGGMLPTWDSGYPGDGNQLLAYYPSWTESFFRNVMKLAGRTHELSKWFDDVAWFWERYTVPEGFTYDAENEGFTPDNPGGKQAFGALGWYTVFFRAIVGFEVDERGVIISPSSVQREISVKNIVVRGRKIDIAISGTGDRTEVTFNGEEMVGPVIVIPFSALKSRNRIVMRRVGM